MHCLSRWGEGRSRSIGCALATPIMRDAARRGRSWVPLSLNPSYVIRSLPRLLEIPQIRRPLAFLRRHQQAIPADHVVLLADANMWVALGAIPRNPHFPFARIANVILGHCPRTRQRVIKDRHFVMQDIAVGPVEVNALPDHSLIVIVQRNAGLIESALSPKVPGLDHERIEFSVSIL